VIKIVAFSGLKFTRDFKLPAVTQRMAQYSWSMDKVLSIYECASDWIFLGHALHIIAFSGNARAPDLADRFIAL
jgi:hypothetical protein